MRLERDDAKVGFIVALALVVFGGLLFHRSLSALVRSERIVHVRLEDVSELTPGTAVTLQGFKVGQVQAIELQRQHTSYHFTVTLSLRPDVVLWKGTKGVVVSKVLGGAFLDLRLPPLAERCESLPPGAVLEGGRTSSLAAFIDRGQAFVTNLDRALDELRSHFRERGWSALLDHPRVQAPLHEAEAALRELRTLAAEGRTVLDRNDARLERSMERLERSLTVLQAVLESRKTDVETLLQHAAALSKDLEELTLEARTFLQTNGPEARDILQSLQRTLHTSEELLQLLKAKPNRFLWGTPTPAEQDAARRRAEEARRPRGD